jgi:hypothetical protein
MRKKPDYNDLARKWPLPFRNGLKYYSHTFRRLLIYVGGDEEITSEMLEQMKKSDLLFDRIISFIHIPKFLRDKIDLQEDALSAFIITAITFKHHDAPTLENDRKSTRRVSKKIKPRRTETGLAPPESVRSSSTVIPDHDQEDDVNR